MVLLCCKVFTKVFVVPLLRQYFSYDIIIRPNMKCYKMNHSHTSGFLPPISPDRRGRGLASSDRERGKESTTPLPHWCAQARFRTRCTRTEPKGQEKWGILAHNWVRSVITPGLCDNVNWTLIRLLSVMLFHSVIDMHRHILSIHLFHDGLKRFKVVWGCIWLFF